VKLLTTYRIVIFLAFMLGSIAYAQKGLYSYGVQYKPLIPFKYFTPSSEAIENNFTTTIAPKMGYSYGMVVRRGITNTIAIEFGINYIKRNYRITIDSSLLSGDVFDESSFGVVSYELPFQGLFYVRLFEDVYMNGASGLSVNFFASNVESRGEQITHAGFKNRWIDLALLSNLGFEYRTEDKGFFYFGASFHLPFNAIMTSRLRYDDGVTNNRFTHNITGRYFTLDFRYFFKDHSAPVPKGEKKKKK
jgi:hypothetical protein